MIGASYLYCYPGQVAHSHCSLYHIDYVHTTSVASSFLSTSLCYALVFSASHLPAWFPPSGKPSTKYGTTNEHRTCMGPPAGKERN